MQCITDGCSVEFLAGGSKHKHCRRHARCNRDCGREWNPEGCIVCQEMLDKARDGISEDKLAIRAWVRGFQKNFSGGSVVRDDELRKFIFPQTKSTFKPIDLVPVVVARSLGGVPQPRDATENVIGGDMDVETEEFEELVPSSEMEGIQEELDSRFSSYQAANDARFDQLTSLLSQSLNEMKDLRAKLASGPEKKTPSKPICLRDMPKQQVMVGDDQDEADDDELDEADLEAALLARSNDWRPCQATLFIDGCLHVGKVQIPLKHIHIQDIGAYPDTMWKYKEEYMLEMMAKKEKPPKQEVILFEKKAVEEAVLSLAKTVQGSFYAKGILKTEKGNASNSAVSVEEEHTPALMKVLSAQREKFSEFLQKNKKVFLNELKPFRQLIPCTTGAASESLAETFAGPAFETDSAITQVADHSMGSLTKEAIKLEKESRMNFLDVVSSVATSEIIAKSLEQEAKDALNAVIKRLLKTVFNLHYVWAESKVALRKEALRPFDSWRPHTKALLQGDLWGKDLFDPTSVAEIQKVSLARGVSVPGLLGSKSLPKHTASTSKSFSDSPLRSHPYDGQSRLTFRKRQKFFGRGGVQSNQTQASQSQQGHQQGYQQGLSSRGVRGARCGQRGRGGRGRGKTSSGFGQSSKQD